mmetsp:Transcript_94060/g.130647  ORF Transcript_94060/g.130647 Transcript_94060/m.130647 type:complete len:239 (-) Transcript_94060:209-925(-)
MQENECGSPRAAVDNFIGRAEVQAAAQAISEFLSRTDENADTLNAFRIALANGLAEKYSAHWWTEQPARGEGFRHLSCSRDRVDPVVSQALRSAGIPLSRLAAQLPHELSVWCDPGAVSMRIGNGDLRTSQIGAGQWTPPVSPALSVSAPEFKPSPPSSPLSSPLSRGQPRPNHSVGPPGLTETGRPHHNRHNYTSSDAMTPPFARFSGADRFNDHMGYFPQQHPLNFYRPSHERMLY